LGGVENTGIENSVRVAFAQIGRVKGNDESTVADITGITCTTDSTVTGICTQRPAQIWEPNDTKHVQGAINWYETACKSRKVSGTDVTLPASYDLTNATPCGTVVDGTPVKTYAVKDAIASSDNVDVYDGEDLNGYEGSDNFLAVYPTFTDEMKDLEGTQRPAFMYLAPNSVTKVRIYVWIEGQDIDNYDFASIGKSISVGFGFTKERFEEASAGYPADAPGLRPEITLNGGDAPVEVPYGTTYTDAGATALFTPISGGNTYTVPVSAMGLEAINTSVPGTYYVTYKTTDTDTLPAYKVRTVVVKPQP